MLFLANRLFASLSIFLILFSACNKGENATPVIPEIEVSAISIKTSNLPIPMEFVGKTKGSIDAEIRTRVDGVITEMHFQEGKEVEQGQLLYTIDDAEYKAKVAQVRGQLAEAETRLVKAESDIKRVRPLVEIKALSQKDLDLAVAQQGVAQGAVDAAKAALEAAEIELGYCKIYSPTKGIIGLTKSKVGEYVGRGPNAGVLNTVSALNPIHVQFQITEQDYLYFAKLKEQNTAAGKTDEKRQLKLELADGSLYSELGQVASVDREIDQKTGTLTIEAAFPNPKKLLRPGQFARIKVVAENINDAILIPVKAIRDLQGKSLVYIVKEDGTVETRLIEVGRSHGDQKLVTKGLQENDTLIVEGIQKIKPGMKVKVNKI